MRIGNVDIPPQTALIAGLGLGLLAVFSLAAIYPAHLGLTDLDTEIASVERKIEEQKILAPIYSTLVKDSRDAPSRTKWEKISKDQVSKLVDIFTQTGTACGLAVVSVIPDPDSLAKKSRLLSVNLVLRGGLEEIRRFMTEVSVMPFVDTIENIRITPGRDGKDLNMVAWLVLE